MDRKFVITAFGYAILGLALGIYMAISKNHGQFITHAHIMLVGFVLTFIYGVCHKLWLTDRQSTLAAAQFFLHQVGTALLVIGLFLLYGGIVPMEMLDPFLGIGSIAVLIAVVLMKVLFIRATRTG